MNLSTVSKVMYGAAFTAAVSLASAASVGSEQVSEVGVTSSGLRTVSVSFSDLDMTDASAQKTLYYRVKRAAQRVCGSSHVRNVGSLSRAVKNKECFNVAMSNALRQVSNTQLAALDK